MLYDSKRWPYLKSELEPVYNRPFSFIWLFLRIIWLENETAWPVEGEYKMSDEKLKDEIARLRSALANAPKPRHSQGDEWDVAYLDWYYNRRTP